MTGKFLVRGFFAIILSSVLVPGLNAKDDLFFAPAPTTVRPQAELRDGWNPSLVLGFKGSHGITRDTFYNSSTNFSKSGWVDRSFNAEVALEYGFQQTFAIQVKVPAAFAQTSVDFYATPFKSFGLGLEVGALSSLYLVASLYSVGPVFITLSPSFQIVDFALKRKSYGYDPSRYFYHGQFSAGVNLPTLTLAAYGSYSYVPGSGLDVGGIFEDTLAKHIVTTGVILKY